MGIENPTNQSTAQITTLSQIDTFMAQSAKATDATDAASAAEVADITNAQVVVNDQTAEAAKACGVDCALEVKLMKCVVDMKAEYPANEFIFDVNGIPAITIGDLHTIGAKQKAGKTSLIAILIAAIACGQWDKVECAMKGISVLYIDTEMKDGDTKELGVKAAAMAGMECLPDNFHFVNFRPLTPHEMELGIRFFIQLFKPQLVIIDGIVDLCSNFNDVEASQNLVINYLMKIAENHKCAILNVLHTNKTDGYTELRGHLGAYLEQKGTTVIKCEKDDANNIVTVSFPTHRYAPVPDFHFTFDENGIPVSADDLHQQIETEKQRTKEEVKAAEKQKLYEQRVNCVIGVLKEHGGSLERKVLVQEVMNRLQLGKSSIDSLLKRMMEGDTPIIKQEEGTVTLSE